MKTPLDTEPGESCCQSFAVPQVDVIAGAVSKCLISTPPEIFKEYDPSLISQNRLKIFNCHFYQRGHAIERTNPQGVSQFFSP